MGESVQMKFLLKNDGSFLEEESARARVLEIRSRIGHGHLLGALHVVCNGVEVVGEAEYDDIPELFGYIVNDIDAIFRGEPFSTYFPDMPLQLIIATRHDLVFISVGKRRSAAPRREFLRELYSVCCRFFDLMLMLFPSGEDEAYMKKLHALPGCYPDVFRVPGTPMSLFLVYFEIGKPVASSPVPALFEQLPITLTFTGHHGRLRKALVLTYGGSSDPFVAFEQGYQHEGKILRENLFEFVRHRLEAGAHPHLVFLFLRSSVETVTVDPVDVVRVPLSELDKKLRVIADVRFMDSSEVLEVTSHFEEASVPTASTVLVDVSTHNAITESDPLRWRGNLDVLAGDNLFRIGPSQASLLVLHCLKDLAQMVARLRSGARVTSVKFEGDSSPVRLLRQTTGGALTIALVYRDLRSEPMPVSAFDRACRDAVIQFFKGLRGEQRVALQSDAAASLLGTLTSVWPEIGEVLAK